MCPRDKTAQQTGRCDARMFVFMSLKAGCMYSMHPRDKTAGQTGWCDAKKVLFDVFVGTMHVLNAP